MYAKSFLDDDQLGLFVAIVREVWNAQNRFLFGCSDRSQAHSASESSNLYLASVQLKNWKRYLNLFTPVMVAPWIWALQIKLRWWAPR